MKYYKRGFLNPAQGMAAFESEVHFEDAWRHHADASFSISDCNRKITLDFNFDDDKDYEDNLFKLTTLISELNEFAAKLAETKVEIEDKKIKYANEQEQTRRSLRRYL